MQMTNNSKVVCFGELLIDMIATNPGDLSQADGFLKKFGGAPANTACGLVKLGTPVSFIGKVGNDSFGRFLKGTLDEFGVDSSKLVLSGKEMTTLAFVSLTEAGERDFIFYKGAHDAISESEFDLPANTYLFHFGSLTQIRDYANKATMKLLRQAQKQGAIVSYDPNIREFLWGDLVRARAVILDTARQVDILKVNELEVELLTGQKDITEAAEKLFTKNLQALFITLGAEGCFYKTQSFSGRVPTVPVEVVDTTGAGDAFNAGYIHGLFEVKKPVSDLSQQELEKILKRAVVVGALTTIKKGAISALPTLEEVSAALK